MDEHTVKLYKSFILNIGYLLGNLSNEKIVELLKEEGITDKQISDLIENVIEVSKIFYK